MPDIRICVVPFTTPTAPGTTGSFNVEDATGPFTAKVVRIFGNQSDGFYDDPGPQHIFFGVGLDDGVTAQSVCVGTQWHLTAIRQSAGNAIDFSILESVGWLVRRNITEGRITAINNGSIDYTLTTNEFGNSQFFAICFGGADFEYQIGKATLVNGTQVFTTTVEPKGLIIDQLTSVVTTGTSPAVTPRMSCGFVDTNLNQASFGATLSGSTTIDANRYQRTDKAFTGCVLGTSAVNVAVVTSFNPTNWTATITNAASVSFISYLVIGGQITVKVGNFLQNLLDGSQTVPVPGMLPLGVLLGSFGHEPSTVSEEDFHMSMGAFDGNNQVATWVSALDGVDDNGMGGEMYGDDDCCMFFAEPVDDVSSNSTVLGKFFGVSLVNNFINGTWTDCDGTAREVVYMAFGIPGLTPAPLSGIYKLVPGRRNDELYTGFNPATTQEVKIPDPFADFALIGED